MFSYFSPTPTGPLFPLGPHSISILLLFFILFCGTLCITRSTLLGTGMMLLTETQGTPQWLHHVKQSLPILQIP